MRKLLRGEFVNSWVLAKDLTALGEAGADDLQRLCDRLRANYGYPVDSVLLTPDLRVLGHRNANEPGATDAAGYAQFLRDGLQAAGRPVPAAPPEPAAPARRPPRAITLTSAAPQQELLDVVQQQPSGQPSMRFHAVDATAFADGGVLEIDVRVGDGAASARFELCVRASIEIPGAGGAATRVFQPESATPALAPGATARLQHEFARGEQFGLAVMPAPGTTEGDTNAFVATVRVRPRPY